MYDDFAFPSLARRVFDLHSHGAYQDALTLVQGQGGSFPDHADKFAYWTACLECRLGQPEDALATLRGALERGLWWPPETLQHEPDLESMRDRTAFVAIVAACEDRLQAARAVARPDLVVSAPVHPKPNDALLIVLHGQFGNAPDALGRWRAGLPSGVVLALPQSSQQHGVSRFGWDDRARAEREVAEAYARMRGEHAFDPAKVVLGGFSQGAALALALALQGDTVPARGVIAVAPAIHDAAALVPAAAAAGRRGVRGWMIGGEEDRGMPQARALRDRLVSAGVDCEMSVVPGLGHDYPPDFDQRLPSALSFVLGKSATG